MKKIVRILWGLPLGAALWFCTTAIVRSGLELPVSLDKPTIISPALYGFGAGGIIFLFVWRMHLPYVFGHELTHWFAAKLFRRQTGQFSVSRTGGSVAVSNPNIWIVLAPYFLPVYTLIWIGFYGAFRFFLDYPTVGLLIDMMYGKTILRLFYGGVGLTYAYHLVMTGYVLGREQKDLQQYGKFLSLSLIVFCNVLLLFLALTIAGSQWTHAARLLQANCVEQWLFLMRFPWK